MLFHGRIVRNSSNIVHAASGHAGYRNNLSFENILNKSYRFFIKQIIFKDSFRKKRL